MKHVFISYAHIDNDFAENLRTELAKADITAWLDHDRLKAGDDWRQSIDKALREAFACIVILSPEADASKYVTYEWAFAFGLGLKVIPILYRVCDNLHPRLDSWQYEDFTRRTNRPWNALVKRLQEVQIENSTQVVASSSGRASHVHGAIQALTTWKPADRAEAARVLGDLRETQAVPGLLLAVRDSNDIVKLAAIHSLGQIGDKRATETLLDFVNEPDTKIRTAAITALANLKDSSAMPQMVEIVRNASYSDIRLCAARALASSSTESELEDLVSLIESEKASPVRVQLIDALARVNAASNIPLLIDCLGDVAEVRDAAEHVLSNLPFDDFRGFIDYGLGHPNSDVRCMVAYMIGEFSDESSIPTLLRYLEDAPKDEYSDASFGIELVNALGNIGRPDVVPNLIKILETYHDEYSGDEVYDAISAVIGKLATPEYIDQLIDLLHASSSFYASAACAEILGGLNGLTSSQGLPDLLISYIRDFEDVKLAAFEALIKQEHMTDIENILSELSGDDFRAKQESVDFIAHHFGVRGLLAVLSIETCNAPWEIVEKIVEIFQPESEPSLIEALKDDFHRVRGFAAESLGQIGKPEYCDPLKPLVDDQYSYIRGIALRALGRIGCTSARDTIVGRLDDESKVFSNETSTVSDYAAIALGQIGDKDALSYLINVISYRSSIGQSELAFEASQLLAKLSQSSQTQALQTLLDSEKWEIRFGAVEILGKIISKANDTDIILTLGKRVVIEENNNIRVGIARVLSDNVDGNAIPILIEMLEDTSFSQIHRENLDIVAVRCLSNIDDPKAQEAVQQWNKNHPNRDMKQTYPFQKGTATESDVNDIPF